MATEYALYKGDKLVTFGTANDIAKERGVLESTIRFYQTPSYQKRAKNNNNRLVLVKA